MEELKTLRHKQVIHPSLQEGKWWSAGVHTGALG